VVQKYVLDKIDDQNLSVLVIWGPMQGYETREHAEEAPSFVPDARASHYWTTAHTCAEAFAVPLGLGDEKAWDTFLVYDPGTEWQKDRQPPAPAHYMHVGRSLPKERRLHGERLAAEVKKQLEVAFPAASKP